jgi:CDP-diacylglycerol--glycerol-3-phosphate 3-phosphatidyltransferase
MILNLPNILTLLRIALIPFIAVLLFIPYAWAAWAALVLYTLACVSDWLDGFFARRMNITSAFGRFLDPIADKLLIAILLLLFAGVEHFDGTRISGIWLIPACIIMFREVLIAGLREFLGPQNIVIHVSGLAKWKTTSQMIALGFLVVGSYGDVVLPYTLLIGQILLTVSAVLTFITGSDYMRQGMKAIIDLDREDIKNS